MADVLTSQSSLGTLVQNVWSRAILWPYRDEAVFETVATARSTTESGMRGKGVTHTFINDLPISTTPINEVTGPDAITFTTSTKTFGLEEYATTMTSTLLARATGWIDLDAAMANLIGFNAGATMDTIACATLATTGNIQRANNRATIGAITATDVLTAQELEIAYTQLDALNVPKINGHYVLFAHPYQIHDLRLQTGAGSWRQPQENGSESDAALRARTTGMWAGFQIVSSNRSPLVANSGSPSTVDTYSAIAVGADALAKSYSDHSEAPGATPKVVFGLPVDSLKRIHPVSWYHLVSYDILRDASVRKIITGASLGANAA